MATHADTTAPRTRQVVTCFLQHEGRILLLRRSHRVRSYPGRWSGVSGSVEGRSALEQAWVEIEEETGLTSREVTLVGSAPPLHVADASLGVTWEVYPFLFAVTDPSAVRLNWENDGLRWVAPSEIGRMNTVPRLEETWKRIQSDLTPL